MLTKTKGPNVFLEQDNSATNADIYAVEVFSALIRHERSRADRAGKAFALVAFSFAERPSSPSQVKALGDRLSKAMRTIDEIGWMRDGRIGVLLPATTLEGAHQFARRALTGEKDYSYQVFIYPDHWLSDYSEESEASEKDAVDGIDIADAFIAAVPAWKRNLDIVGASFALLVLWPIFLVVAGYIKLVSPGPAIFKQQRVGLGGKLFTFIKFRTMKIGNDEKSHQEHIIRRIRAGESLAKLDDADSRIIPGGKFLRKTCIDELPQLFNVLRGDMSLVGPRPCVVYEAREYLTWHTHRFDVLPGMTGLWQVSGKNKLTITQMIRLDIAYASKMSLWNDLKILARTVPAIIVMVAEALARKFKKEDRMADQKMLIIEEPSRERAML
jgi:lipopolysaccharide/colanic/teichoic acid biosynthesis glycosyltransferase